MGRIDFSFLKDIILMYEFSSPEMCDAVASQMADYEKIGVRQARRAARTIRCPSTGTEVDYGDLWKLREIVRTMRSEAP